MNDVTQRCRAQVAGCTGMRNVSCSSGYLGALAPSLRWKVPFLMKVYMPVAAAFFGFVPTRWMGWGEDLPAGVALQWARWCSRPGYVENGFGKEIKQHYYDSITAPILSLIATDDEIANEWTVDDLLRLFTKAPATKVFLNPSEFGLKQLGHSGFFRRASRQLWPLVTDWINGTDEASARLPMADGIESRKSECSQKTAKAI